MNIRDENVKPSPVLSFQLLTNKQIGLKRYEVDGRKVLFYFDEVRLNLSPSSQNVIWLILSCSSEASIKLQISPLPMNGEKRKG